MPWLLNEDEALKNLLTGMTVSDDKNPNRSVGVWFGQPDIELRQQIYPYITIDLIDISEATERAQRNQVTLPYTPEGFLEEDGKSLLFDYPIPYNLDYQVRVWARHPRHDRKIVSDILRDKISPRYSSIYVPQDNTVRSIFLLSLVKRDVSEQARRLFSTVLNVRVFSELTPTQAVTVGQVLNVNLTMNRLDS